MCRPQCYSPRQLGYYCVEYSLSRFNLTNNKEKHCQICDKNSQELQILCVMYLCYANFCLPNNRVILLHPIRHMGSVGIAPLFFETVVCGMNG